MSLLYSEKHSYLVKDIREVVDFDWRVMIRMMDKEMGFHTTYGNLKPPFLKLASSHPVIYSPNVDGVRAKSGFGRWALPKLMRQLRSRNVFVVMRTLNSVSDLVHDPEKGYEAIRVGLVDRLTSLMLHEKPFVRERICQIFHTLGGLEAGRRAIIRRYKILKNLILLLEDADVAVRHKAHRTLELVCLSPVATTGLNYADFTVLILRLIGGTPKTEDQDDTLILHLQTLAHFLKTDCKVLALEHNAMPMLMEKVSNKNEEIQKHALECLGLLCQIPEGRTEGEKLELPLFLCKTLCSTTSLAVKAKVTSVMAFVTILLSARLQLAKKCVVEQIMEVLEYFHSSEGQLMATRVLANMMDTTKGQLFVKSMKNRIKNVFTKDDEVVWHKKQLLNLIKLKSSV